MRKTSSTQRLIGGLWHRLTITSIDARIDEKLHRCTIMNVMPIFEYICRDCDHRFETLVSRDRPPVCPTCRADALRLDKQLSVFAVAAKSNDAPSPGGACGACGDPRGPGACSLN
jgi:putative FmdB family regulatory protein